MAVEQKRVSEMPLVPDGQLGSFDVFGWNKTTNQSGRAPMSKLKGDSGKSAYELWLQQPGNAGKPYSEYEAYNREPATAAKNEWNVLKPEITNKITEAGEAAEAANTAATNANDKAGIAQTAATNANSAASAANTAKDSANAAAANANNKASAAQTAADNATEATEAANTAKNAANTAAENANNKATAAQTATTNANTAAQRANDAADAIENITGATQSDWNETNTASLKYIQNKPSSLPASDVQAWAKESEKPSYDYSEIKNKPLSMPASDVQAWAKAATKPTYDYSEIKNKPTIPVQVNSDWNAVGGIAEIKNKPTSMPASDVQAWAKAATKPAYTASEVGASPLNHTHNYQDKEDGKGLSTNDFTNDYKSFVAFLLTSQSLTSTVNIPIAANTEVSISANMSLSIANSANLKPGYVMTIRINNTGGVARTVTLPSTANWINDFGTTLSIAAYSRAEVSVWCYKTGYYAIRVGEV